MVAVSISQTLGLIWTPSAGVFPWYFPHHAQYLSKDILQDIVPYLIANMFAASVNIRITYHVPDGG